MKTNFVVTDEDGNISWSDKTEAAESFDSFKAAEKRAKELAGLAPGQTIHIYELAAEVVVPTLPVRTTRANQ